MTHDRTFHSRETWALARDDYLAGLSGPNVCRRYGLKERTLRQRATREGWRHVDQPASPPSPEQALDLSAFHEVETIDAVEEARLNVVAATMQGRAADALRWSRVLAFWRDELEVEADRNEADDERRRLINADRRARGLPVYDESLAGEDDPFSRNIREALQEGVDPDERWMRVHGPVSYGPPSAQTPSMHPTHPDFSAAALADGPPAPTNRAERRRLARQARSAPPP